MLPDALQDGTEGSVTYVVRGKLAFPSWDKTSWQSASKEGFARGVDREVPYDWRGE